MITHWYQLVGLVLYGIGCGLIGAALQMPKRANREEGRDGDS